MKNEENLTNRTGRAVRYSEGFNEIVKGYAAGLLTAVVFGLGGFFLIYDRTGSMGWVLFLVLPIATGFATALVARFRSILIASILIGLMICTVILLVTGYEGFVCVLMSLPLIVIGMTVGALLGSLVRLHVLPRFRKPRIPMMLLLLVLPLFLMGANTAETPSRRILRAETIVDTTILDGSPEVIWNDLKTMDSVRGTKTFLMKIGLPVPVSCKTEGEGVGGKRTCYFETGYIEERITRWDFPNSMQFEITASDVPGRPWLSFRDAGYEFKRDGNRTVLTRTTTIVSRLSPAWYWRRLEAIGVRTEHRYLFEALENDLKAAK